MTEKQERFIRDFTAKARNHHEWREIMEFALPMLLGAPALLFELVYLEAFREKERNKWEGDDAEIIPDRMNFLFYQMGLGIAPRDGR